MAEQSAKIIWTKIDEAPMLATYSLLPVVRAFTKNTGVEIETKDISLAGRILATFPDYLNDEQRVPDHLAELGALTQKKEANIIKLPNISASIPQLQKAIRELQSHGYAVPDYPENPSNDTEKQIHSRYAKVLGSAVNPVLRQGNSDRRAPSAVKQYARKHPESGLKLRPWSGDSKTHVAYMGIGDFYGNEKSVVLDSGRTFRIELRKKDGVIVLKDSLHGESGEVLDATFMSWKALRKFYRNQINDARKNDILLSLHLKATMMKVSDPVMFGHAVSTYFEDVVSKHQDALREIGFNPNNGIEDLYARMRNLPDSKQKEIESDIESTYRRGPKWAMVDSDKGITNLHLPNYIIVDASMPVVIRDGGRMWGPDGKLADTKAMIPDRCYAGIYQAVIEDCRKHGAYDRSAMGSVSNVGLMAMKAEEYGSHPTTFEIPEDGTVVVIDDTGRIWMEHSVERGDIWRMSRVKDIAIRDWVQLAVKRARVSGIPAVFWLDKARAHDANLIEKVELYLKDYVLSGLDIMIKSPVDAMNYSLERIRRGEDTISVTGNVLRDYLTDLFPILELGTSAKMLSIVPLLSGGGLFETGAGGSAPKHVDQFLREGHLRWDSLGEYSALGASLEHLSEVYQNPKARILAKTLDRAVGLFLENEKSPSRKVHELDNRGSNFYFAMYWAKALSEQTSDDELRKRFDRIYRELSDNEDKIIAELNDAQGRPVDIGGYYQPDEKITSAQMRPSETLNRIIDTL